MNNTAPATFLYRNHHMETFVIDYSRNGIKGAILGVIAPANANQMKFLSCQGVFSHRMEAETTNPVTPGNPAGEFTVKIGFIYRCQHLIQVMVSPLRANRRDTAPGFQRFFALVR